MFVIVIGGGKTGSHLAKLLLAAGHQVQVIELREEIIEKLEQELPPDAFRRGNGADPKVLVEAGIKTANVVAAVTGFDEDNIVVSTIARFEFNVPRVIARVNNPRNAWLFTPDNGVDVAINQSELMARLIVEEMSLHDMITLVSSLSNEVRIVQQGVGAGAPAEGKTLREISLPEGCTLAAIIRGEDVIAPRGDTLLQAGDEVVAVLRGERQPELERLLSAPPP